jgi:hypothetical protein
MIGESQFAIVNLEASSAIGCLLMEMHIRSAFTAIMSIVFLSACGVPGPAGSKQDVQDTSYALWDKNGKRLTHWNGSPERASAEKLTYGKLTFYPQLEKKEMKKKIAAMSINNILEQLKNKHCQLIVLSDGRVLASGGYVVKDGASEIVRDLAIIDPTNRTLKMLSGLQVPRNDHAVVQMKDGRVIFIGGKTTKQYADDGTVNLTNTVEELDLQNGRTKVIGRITVPRHGVFAERVADGDILVAGGWNERAIARDERWWPDCEIFQVAER